MSFIEALFPVGIAKGSQGGAVYSTDVVVTGSGSRYANINWDAPSYEFDVATGVRSVADMYSLMRFFHAVKGQGHGFRFTDLTDWKSCDPQSTPAATDQTVEDDATAGQTTIQLIKTYSSGTLSTIVNITKPRTGTVLIKLNSNILASGWSVDLTTGIVTFVTPLSAHDVVKAGYEFDLPMCFASDKLPRRFESYRTGEIQVPIVSYR